MMVIKNLTQNAICFIRYCTSQFVSQSPAVTTKDSDISLLPERGKGRSNKNFPSGTDC